jgi:hypothetical protein
MLIILRRSRCLDLHSGTDLVPLLPPVGGSADPLVQLTPLRAPDSPRRLLLHISADSGTPFLAGQLSVDLHVAGSGLRHHLGRNRRPGIRAVPITQ